jgi:hypothetical protein
LTCFFYFSGIDSPEIDPLFEVSQNLQRHSYGSNLSTALLFVQQDTIINCKNEDRFQVFGPSIGGRIPVGIVAQKNAGKSIMTDLIASWYPANSRPVRVAVHDTRRFVAPGSQSLPPLIFIFADASVAKQICF